MKTAAALVTLLVSSSALAATNTPSTLRTKPQPAPRSNTTPTGTRYAQEGTPVATASTSGVSTTRRSYMATDLLTWTRTSGTSETTPTGQATTSTDFTTTELATSPASFDIALFFDRYALRVAKNFAPETTPVGADAANRVEGHDVRQDHSALGLGYLLNDNTEVGASVELFNYSLETETGANKATVDASDYGFGPYVVYTMPMSNYGLEITGRAIYVTGSGETKDAQGTKRKSIDSSGFQFGAQALAVYPLSDLLDLAAGAHFVYTKTTDKPTGSEDTDKSTEFGLTLANVRIKF